MSGIPLHADPPLPNLTVQQLAYLDAAMHAPSWARAAAALGVTPSALSQGIAELERRLGMPLFAWDGRRRVPLPEAGEVLAYAARVLAQTRDLARWAAELREGRAGRLRVGMIDAAAVHHFPEVVRAFRQEYPAVDLHLAVAPSGQLIDQLVRGELDLVVCVEAAVVIDGLAVTPLLVEPLAVYAPPGQRSADPARWGPWVTFPAGSHTRALVAAALRRIGAPFEVRAESHQPEVLQEMVRLGMGWAVLPVSQAEQPPAPLERAVPDPVTSRRLVALRRDGGPPNAAADALLARLLAGGVSRSSADP